MQTVLAYLDYIAVCKTLINRPDYRLRLIERTHRNHIIRIKSKSILVLYNLCSISKRQVEKTVLKIRRTPVMWVLLKTRRRAQDQYDTSDRYDYFDSRSMLLVATE